MSRASNVIQFQNNQDQLFAILSGTDCKPAARHPAAAPTVAGTLSVIAAAERAVVRGRHAGSMLAAYNAADAAACVLLFRIGQAIMSRAPVADCAIEKLAGAADGFELAGDIAVADLLTGIAEKWYSQADRLNHDGFRALSCAQQV